MKVELFLIKDNSEASHIATAVTNDDGRVSQPFLEGELTAGTYELRFYVKDYFDSFLKETGIHSIWGIIPIRFQVSDGNEHYHIPLLVAPGGYSTYRGS